MDWIKTSERLPKDDQIVDIWAIKYITDEYKRHIDMRYHQETRWSKKCFTSDKYISGISIENVTHWMLRPKFPMSKKQVRELMIKAKKELNKSICMDG